LGLTAQLLQFTELHICALHFSMPIPTRQTLPFSTAIYRQPRWRKKQRSTRPHRVELSGKAWKARLPPS